MEERFEKLYKPILKTRIDMNDYKDKYGYTTRRKIEVPKRELAIRGHKVSSIKREDIENFCKARAISPEWLVSELIKEID